MTHSKLQTKRLEAQMSQSQLAAAAGINGRMLQYYEQGAKVVPSWPRCSSCAWLSTAHWLTFSLTEKQPNC